MILVEAQSTWSPNIVIRMMSYAVQSLMDYFREREVFLYGNRMITCPKPELYVVYTGERGNEPSTLSFRELFFNNDASCDLDALVHVIYYKDGRVDIINQYIMFCRVFNAQIKLYGYTEKALTETLRICRNSNILSKYIIQRETEIMDIMTALFDQDYVTRMYGIDQRREGFEEGEKKGEKRGLEMTALNLIKLGMSTDVISKATGLSQIEIDNLRKKTSSTET